MDFHFLNLPFKSYGVKNMQISNILITTTSNKCSHNKAAVQIQSLFGFSKDTIYMFCLFRAAQRKHGVRLASHFIYCVL